MTYNVLIDGKNYQLELQHSSTGWKCRIDGREIEMDAVLARRDVISLIINGKAYEVKRERTPTDMHIWVGSARYGAEVRDPRSLRSHRESAGAESGPRKLVAPMPGRIVRVLVSEKSEVDAGQGLVVVEAMKMQNEIKSPKKGIVQKLVASAGANVNAGDVLAIVE
jgi:biotin carboxyl carrier protein